MIKHKIISILLITTVTIVAVFLLKNDGPMPFDIASTEAYLQANSQAMKKLLDNKKGRSNAVLEALAFRTAVTKLGYDPDKTLLYWISPEFREEINQGDPAKIVTDIRYSERLIDVALGDLASDQDFAKIISFSSPELREAAQNRRNSLRN